MALYEDSTNSKGKKYHVFLSFRGEDTRLNFADHLYEALVRKGVITFRDDEELERGEVISQNLLLAIEESLIAIVIISKNYASSTWCLDELHKIVDCKQSLGLEVFPIFYGVDPSDVRHQRESFAEAFKEHELKFKGDKEKVQKWRDALKYVTNLSGWDSKNQHESKFIDEIVEQVWTKLGPKLPTNTDGLVAIETKVDDLCSLLKQGLQDVRLIGICGMGGMGKTTLADIFFNRMRNKFDYSYFLANVREASTEGDQGLIKLQDKLISHLKPNSMIIDTLSRGKNMIKNLLHNKKVLVVLDDVSSEIQLEILAGNQNWFGPGSRIIVTTRDTHLLTSHGLLLDIYEMRILNDQESLRLFCEKAFKGNQPLNDYLEISKKVVEYTGGLPLALKVLGSLLHGRSVEEWEATLIQIRQFPPRANILNQLKISYDMLEDEYKTIFLSIACFFKRWNKNFVTKILEDCGLHPTTGINVLIEKSLVTCDENLQLGMHDLLEELGKDIVWQESPSDPGRRRWLWSTEDIDEVLSKNTGTKKVQGIVLGKTMSYDARWQLNAFSKMCNLRLLIIYCDLHLQLGLKCLSSSLKVLIWRKFPLKALPLDVQLDKLVYLMMCQSKIEKLWNGTHFFEKLKVIDLTNSEDLIETPDISGVPNLTKLLLGGCTKLVKVHHSVVQHKKLEILSFYGCINLQTLPSKMEMCSLKVLSLSECSKLRRLPDFEEKMERVSEIDLQNCKKLLCLPNTISNLKSLKVLNICGCSKVDRLPNNINENKALEVLDLRHTSIREVDSSTFHLENLKRLIFDGCSGHRSILKSQGKSLRKRCRERDQIITTESLILPRFISNLSSLTTLSLRDCNLKSLPEDIGNLPSLESLDLMGNVNLTLHLDSIANLPKLRCLIFYGDMCGSRILLPSHVRIYPEDSAVEASVVDGCSLWKLLESCCNEDEHMEDCSPSLMFGIPSRITNRENSTYCLIIPVLSRHDSSAYILNDFGLGAWWGVAVYVSLDPLMSSSVPLMTNSMYLKWSFQPPSQDAISSLFSSTTANSNHYLITMIMNDNIILIQRHQSGYHHNDESKRFHYTLKPEVVENTLLYVNVEVEGRKIRKCWMRQLGKDDFRFEMLTKPREF